MLMLAYGASVGGLLTPVGSPPNLIGRGLIEEATGERISFLEWMRRRAADLRRHVRRAVRDPAAAQPARGQAAGGRRGVRRRGAEQARPAVAQGEEHADRLRRRRSRCGSPPASSRSSPATSRRPTRTSPTASTRASWRCSPRRCCSCCPTNWEKREFTLTWNEAKDIDWGTILLFGSGIVFGALLAGHRAGGDDRQVQRRHVRRRLRADDHDLRRHPRDPDLGDDEQHGERRRSSCRS